MFWNLVSFGMSLGHRLLKLMVREGDLPNRVRTHSVLAFPSVPSPKMPRYKLVSIKLNRTASSVRSNSGFWVGATARRSLRAFAAVSIEISSPSKCAATAAQTSGAKEWLSPEKVSFLLRLPSCSMTERRRECGCKYVTVLSYIYASLLAGACSPPCFDRSSRWKVKNFPVDEACRAFKPTNKPASEPRLTPAFAPETSCARETFCPSRGR